MKYLALLTLLITVSLTTHTARAQSDACPARQLAAFTEARAQCADIADGQACYGSATASAEFNATAPDFAAGDRVALADLATLSTSTSATTHGVALIQTHSYSTDTWQAQPVTLMLIGDTALQDMSNEGRVVPVQSADIVGAQGANVRSGTSTDYRIITTLFAGDTVKVIGKLADESWVRVQLPDGANGWVVAGALATDLSDIPPADNDTPPVDLLYPAYARFDLETEAMDAPCAGVPESGVLVQTPPDVAVRLMANEQAFTLAGTAFLQADATELALYVIEGRARIGGATADEGYVVRVDETRIAAPTIYDFDRMAHLPTYALPRYVYIGLEIATLISPAPTDGTSPLTGILVNELCVITTGEGGSNLRAGAGREFPIRGVMAMRETARPIAKTIGTDGSIWWELAQNVWVSGATTVTGGDCVSVPQSQRIPVLPPSDDSD